MSTPSIPYYGGSTPYKTSQLPPTDLYPRGRGRFVSSPYGLVGVGALRGGSPKLGTVSPVEDIALNPYAYAVAVTLGSAVGGAAVGYVAGRSRTAAVRGATLTAGLATLVDAGALFSYGKAGAATLTGVFGVGLLGFSLFSFARA